MGEQNHSENGTSFVGANGPFGLRVHQAAGMVAVQAACPVPTAVELLVGHATKHGCSVDQTAQEVVDRRLRFD